MRPWKATPEEKELHQHWADYVAFERWWQEFIEDTLPADEDAILRGTNGVQQAHLYSRLAAAFDEAQTIPLTQTRRDDDEIS